MSDLAGYSPARSAPQAMQLQNATVYLPSARVGSGAFAATLFDNLGRGAADAASVADALKQTLARYAIGDLPADLGATGFAAVDANGQAAACAVTMNGPFGSGHTAIGTGVTLARAPSAGQTGLAGAFLTPVVATDSSGRAVSLAGAGAGGPNGTAAIADALRRLANGEAVTRAAEFGATGTSYDTVNAIVCQNDACVPLADRSGNAVAASGAPGP